MYKYSKGWKLTRVMCLYVLVDDNNSSIVQSRVPKTFNESYVTQIDL